MKDQVGRMPAHRRRWEKAPPHVEADSETAPTVAVGPGTRAAFAFETSVGGQLYARRSPGLAARHEAAHGRSAPSTQRTAASPRRGDARRREGQDCPPTSSSAGCGPRWTAHPSPCATSSSTCRQSATSTPAPKSRCARCSTDCTNEASSYMWREQPTSYGRGFDEVGLTEEIGPDHFHGTVAAAVMARQGIPGESANPPPEP